MKFKEQIKQYVNTAKEAQTIKLQDGSTVKVKVVPKLNPKDTKLGITFSKDIKDDDVEIIVKVNGEVNSFISGINNSNFTCNASFSKRF